MPMAQVVRKALEEAGIPVIEEAGISPKAPSFAPIPALHPLVRDALSREYPGGLYSHQSAAIEAGLNGRNVCISTGTASGKTLVFTSLATSMLLRNRQSTVVALYPMRALLNDQAIKWRFAVNGTGIDVQIIDGSVPVRERRNRLQKARILLMTPDVFHAWLLPAAGEPEAGAFLRNAGMVILDEAHIYDGVFGTNMAYLVRRFRALAGEKQLIAGTATIEAPESFLRQLTGLSFDVIGPEEDGAIAYGKTILLCPGASRSAAVREFLRRIASGDESGDTGRFIVFTDSRKRVEELVSEARTPFHPVDSVEALGNRPGEEEPVEEEPGDGEVEDLANHAGRIEQPGVLPYRSGYEDECRSEIQQALMQGRLRGVVSTSALELGIDIGNIALVVMIGAPSSAQSFLQRAGRAGRHCPGLIVVIDTDDRVARIGLRQYLDRPLSPNWLYLDNEFIRYANVLCAAEESKNPATDAYSNAPFSDLNEAFRDLLENERHPVSPIPLDLYPLKQQAAESPHHAFPLRTCVEKNYQVALAGGNMGSLTYSQVLREGYPGAIYRYLARPYRVNRIMHGAGQISVRATRTIARTTAKTQKAVFPSFPDSYVLLKSDSAFVCESNIQVSERVVGFRETIGRKVIRDENYGTASSYSQTPLNRFLHTTGVTFSFPEEIMRDHVGRYVCDAFCAICQIREGDVGWGSFFGNSSPLGVGRPVRGFSIYDSAFGSMRLTKQIPSRLEEIFDEAGRLAEKNDAPAIARSILEMKTEIPLLHEATGQSEYTEESSEGNDENEWVRVVAPGELALLHDGVARIYEDVRVLSFVYSPKGIIYNLEPKREGVRWTVPWNIVIPSADTKMLHYNVNTGESRES